MSWRAQEIISWLGVFLSLSGCGPGAPQDRQSSAIDHLDGAHSLDGPSRIVPLGAAGGAGHEREPFQQLADADTAPTSTDALQLQATLGSAGTAVPATLDPGTAAWQPVAPSDVRAVCGLDAAALARADRALGVPWAVVRHGRLCHSFRASGMLPEEAFSTTKSLGGVVAGIVAYQTRMLSRRGPKTGPLGEHDRVDHWLTDFSYNRDAQLGHVLGMVATSESLALGRRTMVYDAFATYLDTLSPILNAAIRQDSERLGADLEQFTRRFLLEPLGMTQSTWSNGAASKTFAFSWSTTVFDMARLGLLILNKGVWNGERLLDAEWLERMTHPAFEDANTGWGYLMWLNAASNHHFEGVPFPPSGWTTPQGVPRLPGTCAPVAIAPVHPHGLSDAPDCQYSSPYACTQAHDVGVWQAMGLFGQVIQGHPGLDLVLVAKNVTGLQDISGMTASALLWDAVRPALVLADPRFQGDDAAFCRAYGRAEYAPALE